MSASRSSARSAIEARKSLGSRALIPFLTAGYPDWDLFDSAVRELRSSGADLIEIGVPFSDPIADGPTIQAASQRALDSGVTLKGILRWIQAHESEWDLPVILMSYANPILAYGAERFAADAVEAGVAGVLVSDLPPEELPGLWQALEKAGLERVVLVAPTTSGARIPRLVAAASAFVYCLTRTGVTGTGAGMARNLAAQIECVRRATDLPLVAGFGLRSREDVRSLAPGLDGVVVGARCIELLAAGARAGNLGLLREFVQDLRRELDGPSPPGLGPGSRGASFDEARRPDTGSGAKPWEA